MKRIWICIIFCAAGFLFAGETEEPHRDWIASIHGGLDYSSGNTEETAYKYGADYEKKNGSDYRYKLKVLGKYRETEGDVADSKLELSGEGRRIFGESRRWFGLLTLSALHDDMKDLAYRVKVGPNIGYYLKDTDDLTADVSSGFLYVREDASGSVEDYVAWRVAQWFDWHFTENARWWFGTEMFTDIADPVDFHLTFRTGVDSKINSHYSLIVVLEDTYDNRPEPGQNIEKNDLEIGVGLRYTF